MHGCREELAKSHLSCLGSYSAWLVMHSPRLRHLRQIAEGSTSSSQEDSWSTPSVSQYIVCTAVQ